jgi:hypothetical protein
MSSKKHFQESYSGFEQGPIRPPSEAQSLLIRVTRNCPWNRCTFCPVYKNTRFSVRPVDHVIRDIDQIAVHLNRLKALGDKEGRILYQQALTLAQGLDENQQGAFQAAFQWLAGGMRSIFIQDANSLIIKPENMLAILNHLKYAFPWVERITSYARSHTLARISDENLSAMKKAGLNRIHIGLESGSDKVLAKVKKGVDKATHIKAGRKVKRAGMELSEYVMPGLGGRELSHDHAVQTADALNRINPDFIRIRTLAVPNQLPLYQEYAAGRFQKLSDLEMVHELRTFIDGLDGIASQVKSDHILNLFEEIDGRLPEDKPAMLAVIDAFLELPPERMYLFQVGRRLGVLNRLEDLHSPRRVAKVEEFCRANGITPENVEAVIEELMKRFI